jgi:hypothetical protein
VVVVVVAKVVGIAVDGERLVSELAVVVAAAGGAAAR